MPISSFLTYLSAERNFSKHTLKAYRKDLEQFRQFCLEELEVSRLETVNYGQIRTWIVHLVESGLGKRSINRKLSALKSFYKFLQKTEMVQTNPLMHHKALKMESEVQVPFSEEEVREVLRQLDEATEFEDVRDRLIIELLYSTGMRRSELIGLHYGDVDLQNCWVKVLGKRNKERYIPLLGPVVETCRNYLFLRDEINTKESCFFLTKKGKKIYDTLVYRVINNYFSKVSSKLKKSPHVIRHSFATHLLNGGADLNSVKELLGHSSLASTQWYTHSSLGKLKEVYNQAHPRSQKT
jgi:integrase/recombinase XerC